jgi:hypothetical protein
MAFTLYAKNAGGSAVAMPVTNTAIAVSNGLFTTMIDFGNVFIGTSNWLELAVSTNGANAFATLSPRQQLTPTPYAIFAEGASNVLGVVPSSGLSGPYPNMVNFVNPGNLISGNFNGSFTGNGGSLIDLNGASLMPGSVGVPQLAPNIGVWNQSGTNIFYNNGNVGIGTANPAGLLDVLGNVYVGTGANNQNYKLVIRGPNAPYDYTSQQNLSFEFTGAGSSQVRAYRSGDYANNLDLLTTDGTDTLRPRVHLDSNGDVGIGTTNPVNSLEVAGTSQFDSDLGIGTTSPDRPLAIQGSGVNGEWISLKNTNGTTKWHLNNTLGGLNFVQSGVSDFRLFLSTNGNVGVGTSTPQSTLAVNGNIQMGSGAANYAVSGTENLRIVRGIVNSAGAVFAGSGFSSVLNASTGSYTITFTPAFSATPTVTASGVNSIILVGGVISASSITVQSMGFGGSPANGTFSFIAIGPP